MKADRNNAYLLSLIYNRPIIMEPAKLQVIVHILQPQANLVLIEGEPPASMMGPVKPSLPAPEGSAIGVVDIMGSLVHRARGVNAESGIRSYETIGNELKALAVDSRVGGILLHMDSPGGEVAGAYELARTVREVGMMKPTWTWVDGMGLSAGYLIASQTQRVLLGSHASVGSVGVILIHLDQSKADEAKGLNFTVLKRGNRKDDFNPHAPLSEGALQFADKLLDREYDLFVEAVAQGRGLAEKKIRQTEAGIVFDEDAIHMGLADGQANFDDAVGEMQSHIAQAKTTVIGGPFMADIPALTAPPASPPVTQVEAPVPVQASAANLRSAADYVEIASLCKIARKPQLAAQFITEGRTVAEVREALLQDDVESESGSEIFSAFAGQAGVAQSLIDAKPKMTLAQSMRQRLGISQEAR